MKNYRDISVESPPKILYVLYAVIGLTAVLTFTDKAMQYWQSKNNLQYVYGCITDVSLASNGEKTDAVHLIDKFNNELKFAVTESEIAEELAPHILYCYNFEVYPHSFLGLGEYRSYITRVDGLENGEEPGLQLADFISLQLEQNAPAAGSPSFNELSEQREEERQVKKTYRLPESQKEN